MKIIYYEKTNGNIPVVDYIKSIKNIKFQSKVLWEIDLLEKYGFDLKKPYVDSIKGKKYNKLFELRTRFSSDISRVFYFFETNSGFVLLNGYTKKDNETNVKELDKALQYMQDYLKRYGGKNE